MNRYEFIGWFLGAAVGFALGLLAAFLGADALWTGLVTMVLSSGLSLAGVAIGNGLYLRHLRAERARHGRSES